MILVNTEIEAEPGFNHVIGPEDYLCQFSDSYLEACGRNSRKTQPAKFAIPPCTLESFLKYVENVLKYFLIRFEYQNS